MNLSMDDLAKKIMVPSKDNPDTLKPITSATVSNIENGKNNPSAEITIALSNFFNVSTDWILTGKEFVEQENHHVKKFQLNELKSFYDTFSFDDVKILKSLIKELKSATTTLRAQSEELNTLEEVLGKEKFMKELKEHNERVRTDLDNEDD